MHAVASCNPADCLLVVSTAHSTARCQYPVIDFQALAEQAGSGYDLYTFAVQHAICLTLYAVQIRRREEIHRMADLERKTADMHSANAAIYGRAAREAYDQGALWVPIIANYCGNPGPRWQNTV